MTDTVTIHLCEHGPANYAHYSAALAATPSVTEEEAERCCVVVDAKRGQVYAALYEREDGRWQRRGEDVLTTPRALLRRISSPACLVGDGIASYPEAFSAPEFTRADEHAWTARVGAVVRLGLRAYREGRIIAWRELSPIYHRRPEAEEKRLRREGKL